MKRRKKTVPMKTRIKRNEQVRVIAGEEKGKRGKVLRVIPETGRALVEGLNLVKRHLRKSQEHPHGQIAEKEAPIALSNLARVAEAAGGKQEKTA